MDMTCEQLKSRFPGLVRHLEPEECKALLGRLSEAKAEPGEEIIAYGEQTDTMYLVAGGLLSIYIEREGKKLILGQAGPGMVVGEVAMIEPGPATATVSVIEEASLLVLDHDAFEAMRREAPGTAHAILQSLSHDLVQRLRNAGAGLLWRIDETSWMKLEAQKDREGWLGRIKTLLVGGGEAGA